MSGAPANDWDAIADLYDVYVGTALDVPFLVAEAAAAGGPVLELMAGTGRVTIPLVEAGARVTAVDASAGMLARLREKLAARGLSAEVVEADVTALDLGRRFDAVLVPFQSFAELLASDARGAALEAIARHLQPGGRAILTLHNPAVRFRRMDGVARVVAARPMPGGGTLVLQLAETLDEASGVATALQFFEAYDAAGVLREKRLMPVRFARVTRAEVEDVAARAGLEVDAVFGDYERGPLDEATSPFLIWRLKLAGGGAAPRAERRDGDGWSW